MNEPTDFDDYIESYNEMLRENTAFFSADEAYFAKYKIDVIRHRITQPISRILEYGCGIGRNVSFLAKAFPEATIIGSDISNASIKQAKKEHPSIEFIQEPAIDQTIEPFDLIFVANVFHHIPVNERAAVVTTLFHRLKTGGKLIVFEHNPYNPVTCRIVNNCPYDRDAVLLFPSELKKYLNNAGFTIIRRFFCLFFPPIFSKLNFLEHYLKWLPLGGQYWIEAKK